jgi:hypothetical protein
MQAAVDTADAETVMSELWAYCDPCGRWFYPEAASGGGVERAVACPVCATDSTTLADRPEQTA